MYVLSNTNNNNSLFIYESIITWLLVTEQT